MADERLSVENVTRTGLSATYNSIGSSDTYLVNNDGRVVLHFKNTDSSDETITVQTPKQVSGLDVEELTATIPSSSGDVFLGPFPPGTFNAAGDVKFTASNGTATECAVLKVK